jgi:hypothetical protein
MTASAWCSSMNNLAIRVPKGNRYDMPPASTAISWRARGRWQKLHATADRVVARILSGKMNKEQLHEAIRTYSHLLAAGRTKGIRPQLLSRFGIARCDFPRFRQGRGVASSISTTGQQIVLRVSLTRLVLTTSWPGAFAASVFARKAKSLARKPLVGDPVDRSASPVGCCTHDALALAANRALLGPDRGDPRARRRRSSNTRQCLTDWSTAARPRWPPENRKHQHRRRVDGVIPYS